mgnify:CR=1 FL=1
MNALTRIDAAIRQVASCWAAAGLLWLALSSAAHAADTTGRGTEVTPLRLAQSSTVNPRSCPLGTTGVYPRCRPVVQRRCPRGTVGRFPNCRRIVRPKCPRGTTGQFPNCRRIVQPKCPRGTVGRFPNCRKIVRPKCPRGTVGKHPNCRKIVRPKCPSGTRGRWPKCHKVASPSKPVVKQRPRRTRRTAPRPARTQPPRRVVTVPGDRRPDEIVVLLDRAQPGNVEFAIAQQYRLVRLQGETNQLLEARVQRYRIPDRRTAAEIIAAMQGDPRINLAQPNYLYRLQGGKAAKRARGSMIAMQYAPTSLQLNAAHKLATGRQARVAVIDSGVDRQHPELVNALAGSFNAVGDRAPKPDAHGTAIAGIIGARAKLLGVAPGVQLLAARAFFRERGGKPLTTTFVLLRAVDWSFSQKARVFNLSFTGPEDNAVRKILKSAHDRGSILVAAAGNAGPRAPPAYPAAYPHVLAITAHDKADKLYKKANTGAYVAAAAPGVDVLVPIPRGGYDVKSGTSFAAAHISGMIALMLEHNPALTLAEVRAHIAETAHDLGPKGHDKLFGAGRADALAAVQAVIKNAGKVPLTAQGRPPVSQASDRK